MTTDPPPSDFEDVQFEHWKTRLPSEVCTNKEIFDEIFSLETWKTVLQPDQRDRIMKMLPPEILKIPGAAEKTIEDLFSKHLVNFGTNPLDDVYDKLLNGHYDPEVVETKHNIVREWRRESLRLKKHYHTKLLQDIVISREKHLRKLVPITPVNNKKNGKKGGNLAATVTNNNSSMITTTTPKKNGKPSTIVSYSAANSNGSNSATNGVLLSPIGGGKTSKGNQRTIKHEDSLGLPASGSNNINASGKNAKSGETAKNAKRGRLEAALLSPPTARSNAATTSSDGPASKRAKQTNPKAKPNSKKAKEQQQHQIIVVTTSQSPSSTSTSSSQSQLFPPPSPVGNRSGTVNQKTSLLLGTLTAGTAPNEPPTLSLRSPSASTVNSSTKSAPPPTSLLESLTSPINLPPTSMSFTTSDGNATTGTTGVLSKPFTKVFSSPLAPSSSASSPQTSNYLPSPVQSSPILASQLQAPSPISVNLSQIAGIGSINSRNSGTASPSHSSITLNYPQQTPLPPQPSTASATVTSQQKKGLLDDGTSSDEFEFETIEPTIGFSGPSTTATASSSIAATTKTMTMVSTATTTIPVQSQSLEYKKSIVGTITTQELANIQKCSLLTNCLTQPLPPNSSSAAAVSAALANNILTSTPVSVTPTGGFHQIQLQQHQQTQKIIVTSGGIVSTSSGIGTQHLQQQLQKFLSTPPQTQTSSNLFTAQKLLTQQQLGSIFQQHLLQERSVIATATPTGAATSSSTSVDAQTLVNSIMAATSKDLLANFGASGSGTSSAASLLNQIQQQVSSQQQNQNQQQHSNTGQGQGILPISLNLQSGAIQQGQLKQATATFIKASPGGSPIVQASGITGIGGGGITQHLLQAQSSQQSLVIGQSSTLNTQSLQLPSSSIVSGGGGNNGNVSVNSTSKIVQTSSTVSTSSASSTVSTNLLDSDHLNNLNLGNFPPLGGGGGFSGMNVDMGSVALSDIDTSNLSGVVGIGAGVGAMPVPLDQIKLEMDCAIDKMDDLSGVLDGNPFDSIPNLSDELDGLDLDMVDGLCDFEVLLSEEKQYASFFSLIRDVLCSTRDHRMTLVCLEKTIKKWQVSPGAALNPWYMRIQDWNSAIIVALNFLAGNYQDVHPEDFVPYIEYKYKTKYYQWIGAGRDGDNNLTPLCNLWMDNLERLPPLKKSEGEGEEPEEEEDDNEDSDTGGGGDSSDAKKKTKRPQTPPPPRFTTDWTVRPSSLEEKEDFRHQEKSRFDNPHKAFTYRMHGYESVVGPVKGVYSSQSGLTNKARGHSLLTDDRPPYVTILALVRDAVARLPNGEGTRSEICEMLRDSAFLSTEASSVTLNSVVSGALDRLHYERDPCVRYDSHKKSWIYLHRDRNQEQFERLHHNRSYTKCTKSRNGSNRKRGKGSPKSSSSSVSSMSGVITTNTPQSSSSSSSQSSISTTETTQSSFGGSIINNATITTASSAAVTATIVGGGSGVGVMGGIISSSSGGSVITLPPLSTINPKMSTISAAVTGQGVVGSGSISLQQPQTVNQAIGLVSVTNPGRIQVQAQQTQQMSTMSGAIQQQSASTGGNTQGIVTLSGEGRELGTEISTTQSFNEVFAAATGLRFQTSAGGGAPVVINQNLLGQQQQQGKQQQTAAILQETTGQNPTTRLILQQSTTQSGAVVQQQQQQQSQNTVQTQQTTNIQIQQPQLTSGSQTAAAVGPGQILLGSSAAVLKLAGNLRLGEGLRLAQLRLPSGATTTGAGTTLAAAASQLRFPQHRILLARGTLPGQHQTQGVLLGQTSTGQTVILSAGPPGASSLAGLQALGSGATGTTSQIALHAPTQTSQLHLDSSHQQSLQTFSTNQGTTKFGIITNTSPNTNSIMVSSGPASSLSASLQQGSGTPVSYSSTTRVQTQQSVVPSGPSSTLPPTSIALPASILAPSSSNGTASSMSKPMQTPSSSSITVSTANHLPQSHQQHIILSGGSGSATAAQQLQQQIQSSTPTSQVSSGGTGATMQLQGSVLSNALQQSVQQQQHLSLSSSQQLQNLLSAATQQSNNASSSLQGQNQSGHHPLTAPIIIRSAQGDFVSFGIPSNLSFGRGVQGIKVIPFQAGKQTVLARIVPPSGSGSVNVNQTTGNVGMALAGSSSSIGVTSLPSSISNSSGNSIIVTSSTSGLANSAPSLQTLNNATTALISGMPTSVSAQQQQSQSMPQTLVSTSNTGNGGAAIVTRVSGTSIVSTQSSNNNINNNNVVTVSSNSTASSSS